MSISLQLLCSEQTDSTVAILKKQISRWSIWFKYYHCKQLLSQKSDWLQMILCHTKRLLTISVRKLCFQIFSSMSLHCIIISTSVRKIWLFSIWSKMLKSSICNTDEYLVNFTENQKRISHLSCMRIKFWKRWIMFLCFSRKWFEVDF